MRIIGGKLAGRRFGAARGRGTRPTSDRAREAIASALQSRNAFENACVLDLFAGTGALGFEALSRGASRVVAVDQDTRAVRQIIENARALGLENTVHVVRVHLLGDPITAVRKLPSPAGGFNLVFADAPYSESHRVPTLLSQLADSGRLAPGAWIVVERSVQHDWAWPNGLASDADYRYGQTGISLGVYEPEKGRQ